MSTPHPLISSSPHLSARLSRRALLRGAGVAISLPLLDAMSRSAFAAPPRPPRRMVAVCTTLGIHGPHLFPTQAGADYTPPPYLEALGEFKRELTVFSGVSHPDVDGGHSSEASFLTAAPHPGGSSFKNSISLDQLAAEQMGSETRHGYLALSTGGNSLSWSRGGVRIPADDRPSSVFARLFLEGTADEVRGQVQKLKDGQSILDTVRGDARRLERDLGPQDRSKLDEYFSSVRELEGRLTKAEEWTSKPKPKVDAPPPRDIASPADFAGRSKLMYDLVHLALSTDSTRLITLFIRGTNLVPPIPGVSIDWHNLSHHGQDEQKIEQLKIIELAEIKLLAELLGNLKQTREEGDTLLDRTMVLYGSNLGNSSSHDTRNMPILLAGGGLRHAGHLAFDPKRNYPLPNLFVSMLQQLGLEFDSFASSTGTMRGLS
jgi:hypothetical protein